MSSQIQKLTVVAQRNVKHTASVIFLHGSGGTGVIAKQSMKMILGREFSFPHIRLTYPTAPVRLYTLAGGIPQHVWFDRLGFSLETREDLSTLDPIAEEIGKLIDQEISEGIDAQRIVVGGFSMGASLAMQMGFRFRPDIGGVFVCSSFLCKSSKVFEALDSSPPSERRRPPLFMCHGEDDGVVPFDWGVYTFNELKKRGVSGEFHSFPHLDHSMNIKVVNKLQDWLLKYVPEK